MQNLKVPPKISTKCHTNAASTLSCCSLKCTAMYHMYWAHLLSSTPGQVLLASQRADGADPWLSHAFDPQHHPAELLAL